MKKLIALLLAAVLLLSLTACDEAAPAPAEPLEARPTPTAPAPRPRPTEAATEPETLPPTEPGTLPPAEPETEPGETTSPEGPALPARGVITGSTYENAFLGFGCTLDDSWVYLDDAQIAELVGLTADSFDNKDLRELLQETGNILDMFAICPERNSASVSVALQDTGVLYGEDTDLASLVEVLAPEMERNYSNMSGNTDVSVDGETMYILGADHPCFHVSAKMEGRPIYQRLIYLQVDNYLCIITLSTYGEDATEDLAALFYALD